jgi:uncharacterized membrane-anchored protein
MVVRIVLAQPAGYWWHSHQRPLPNRFCCFKIEVIGTTVGESYAPLLSFLPLHYGIKLLLMFGGIINAAEIRALNKLRPARDYPLCLLFVYQNSTSITDILQRFLSTQSKPII